MINVSFAEKAEGAKNCLCAALKEGSKKAFLGRAGFLFSIIVVGWVLGVVAFLRTL
jgi:hypothetical protein